MHVPNYATEASTAYTLQFCVILRDKTTRLLALSNMPKGGGGQTKTCQDAQVEKRKGGKVATCTGPKVAPLWES